MRSSFSPVSADELATLRFNVSTSLDSCTIISLCAAMVDFCCCRRDLISLKEETRVESEVDGVLGGKFEDAGWAEVLEDGALGKEEGGFPRAGWSKVG